MYYYESFNKTDKKKLSLEPYIDSSSSITDTYIGKYTEIGKNNSISESSIGDYSYTCENCQIIYSEIAKFVNIASYVRLNPGQHPMQWASQHHFLYRKNMYGFGEDDDSFFEWRRNKKVTIGNDVWLGHNSLIMGGVSVGDGAVVGSCSVVTKDVAPYSVVAGVPAKVIKYRFNEEIIEKMLEIKWWDWPHEVIGKRLGDFKDTKYFIRKYGNG